MTKVVRWIMRIFDAELRQLIRDELEKFKSEAGLACRFEEVTRRLNEMEASERQRSAITNQRLRSLEHGPHVRRQ